ncbi:MAG: hypothetical protein R3F38_00380 [Gammaproteobacteria bacterium]
MARSLRSLEQSLGKPAKPAKTRRRSRQYRQTAAPEGRALAHAQITPSPLAPSQLQEQIDVIRGRRVAEPTSSLRALEDRVLGRTPATQEPRRTTQRLDNGQVPPPAEPVRAVANALTAPPHTGWSRPTLPATTAAPYAPEFSAPDTGRFQVEPFSAPLDPESIFRADTAVSTAPSPTPAIASPVAVAPISASPQRAVLAPSATQPRLVEDDATGWLTQAQSEQPEQISSASRNALDGELALAKDDFERELASILGQSTTPAPKPDPLFANAPAQQLPAPPAAVPAPAATTPEQAPPAHPGHDIFDQMGLGMRYANSFNLGNVNLSERFRQFEQDLEQPAPRPATPPANPFVDPFVEPMSLDDFDLVAELAEIGAEQPAAAPTPTPQNQTENTAGEDHDKPIG